MTPGTAVFAQPVIESRYTDVMRSSLHRCDEYQDGIHLAFGRVGVLKRTREGRDSGRRSTHALALDVKFDFGVYVRQDRGRTNV